MSEDKSKIPATRIHTDAKPVEGSVNLITSGAVAAALDEVLEQTVKRAEADVMEMILANLRPHCGRYFL